MSFIYNILVDHSLIWGKREYLILAGLAVAAGLIVYIASRRLALSPGRGLALWCMLFYVVVISCAVVFFRPVVGGAYQLDPFVEWRNLFDALMYKDRYAAGYWAVEIVINLLMLLPVGVLLPLAAGRRVPAWCGLLLGACLSLAIETLQFKTDVGLFHTADMLHNALGCGAGCWLVDALFFRKKIT